MKKSLLALATTLATASVLAQAPPPAAATPSLDAAAAKQHVDALLDKNYAHLDAVYKDIHGMCSRGSREASGWPEPARVVVMGKGTLESAGATANRSSAISVWVSPQEARAASSLAAWCWR
jgi:hypothetical protein